VDRYYYSKSVNQSINHVKRSLTATRLFAAFGSCNSFGRSDLLSSCCWFRCD